MRMLRGMMAIKRIETIATRERPRAGVAHGLSLVSIVSILFISIVYLKIVINETIIFNSDTTIM